MQTPVTYRDELWLRRTRVRAPSLTLLIKLAVCSGLLETEWDGEYHEQQRGVFGEMLGPWTCAALCRTCTPHAADLSHHLSSPKRGPYRL